MNAPEAGTIKEYLANEEETVTVGQDLLRLELGGAPQGGDKQDGGQEPKAPAPEDQSTSSDPKPNKDEGTSDRGSSKKDTEFSRQHEHKQGGAERELPASKQSPSKSSESDKPESKNVISKAIGSDGPYGNREQRRVCHSEMITFFTDAFYRLK